MSVKGLSILSIDDSKAVHAFLDRCFNGTSHRLTHVYDPVEGLKILKERADGFSLVLLDWEMPQMTGPDLLAEARKCGVTVPVIMLTSKNAKDDILRSLSEGANEYVMKPFTPEILLDKINEVVGGGE